MTATYRLYRDTPYRTEFDAIVVEETTWEAWPAVVLDVTCFYPTSGGQPNDLGTLEGIPVIDVIEQDERILHVLEAPLTKKSVHGSIAWPRRFDHMQQHTGQHILSGAFENLMRAATVSFHLGSASSTIDIATATLEAQDAFAVEDLANRVVFENRTVLAREYDENEIDALPLRKAPTVHGQIRVVTVQDFDASACGGTHVAMAGQVGNIHLSRWERHRGQTRVEFLCGWRALHAYRNVNVICQKVAARIGVRIDELPESVSRQMEMGELARQEVADLQEKLLEYDVSRLASEAITIRGVRILHRVLRDYDGNHMRYLAQRMVQQEPKMIVLLAIADPSPQICFARSADVEQDMSALFREVMAPLGGRGGGRPNMAQGGGVTAEQLNQLLQAAIESLERALGGSSQ